MLIFILGVLFPTAFTMTKAILLFLVLAILMVAVKYGQLSLDRKLISFSLFFSTVGLAWSIYGFIVGNPGAIRVLTVMAAYPLIFSLLLSYWDRDYSDDVCRLILFVSAVLIFFNFLFLWSASDDGYFAGVMVGLYGDAWASLDTSHATVRYTLPSISSMLFMLPFLICMASISKGKSLFFSALLVVLLTVLLVFSGRRVALFSTVIGVGCAFLIRAIWARQTFGVGRLLVGACSILLLLSLGTVGGSLVDQLERYLSVFDWKADESNIERALQFESLMQGIYASPLLGAGAGAAASYVRSEEMPWAYELFYVSMIFQYGILGFSLYAIGVLSIIVELGRKIRDSSSGLEFSLLAGMIAFLVASATNPYIGKFDYMWVIFLPAAVVWRPR